MELNDCQHSGGVVSHTHQSCLVQEPVTVVIEGNRTALSLDDAKSLVAGLSEAIALVECHETSLKGDGDLYNLLVIGKSGSGMSVFPLSKLGINGTIKKMLLACPPEMRTLDTLHALMPPSHD